MLGGEGGDVHSQEKVEDRRLVTDANKMGQVLKCFDKMSQPKSGKPS